jgi:hypothetical protein
MTEYFILIKRKELKNWEGVIPTRNGVNLKDLRDSVAKHKRKGLVTRIVTKTQIQKELLKLKPKGVKLKAKRKL